MINATQCGCARTLLRWSISKLSSAASVSQSAIDDFELERRQPNAITTDAIQRAFEGVGVVFLPQDDVQLRSDVSLARRPQAAREQRIFEADRELYNAYTARRAAQSSTQCIYGNGIISC